MSYNAMQEKLPENVIGREPSTEHVEVEKVATKLDGLVKRQNDQVALDSKKLAIVRQSIRTNRGVKHYKAVFGPELAAKSGAILDVAAGDSDFAEVLHKDGKRVVRLDANYAEDLPEYDVDAVAGLAEHMPFDDGEFSEVLSSYLMEHVNPEDVITVLREMLRVTEPGGVVRIYPCYFYFTGTRFSISGATLTKLGSGPLSLFRLDIENNPARTAEETDALLLEIAQKARFVPYIPLVSSSVAQKLNRAFMSWLKWRRNGSVNQLRIRK